MNQKLQHPKYQISHAKRFSEEEIGNFYALGEVLRSVRLRLKREGVSIEQEKKKIIEIYELQKSI